MSSFNIDLQTGYSGENKCQKFLETLYPKCDGYVVEKYKDKYAPFDFYVELNGVVIHEYEIKNRSCASYGYWMIKIFMGGSMLMIQSSLKKVLELTVKEMSVGKTAYMLITNI